MRRAAVVAVGAISALGEGSEAIRAGGLGEPARSGLGPARLLEAAGLRRTLAGLAPRISSSLRVPLGSEAERASLLLGAALGGALEALEAARPGFRGERIGIALGTSSGGMIGATRFFDALLGGEAGARPPAELEALAKGATYFAPFEEALESAGLGTGEGSVVRRTQVLAACAASTIAIGLGLRWLERGACDLVLAGGYDALSVFVASGFEALRATCGERPRPFRKGRDGMALGEGAAVLALVPEERAEGAAFFVCGFGASTDAVHITAPDRTGSGLARAAELALEDAGASPAAVGLVSAHGTSTPFNDAAEARVLARVFRKGPPVVHAFKAQIGHSLGAAGALETLAAASALAEGYLPATPTEGELDPDASAPLLEQGEPSPPGRPLALKLSAAFGGANAALVVAPPGASSSPRPPRPPERAVACRVGPKVASADLGELSAATGVARDRLARLDGLGRLGASALAALAALLPEGHLAGAGIVVGGALATLETNFGYHRRLAERGALQVEPRVFPATSPQALAGECAILFGLTGPSFAVGASLAAPFEALARAAELVAYGFHERVVVVSADDAGPATRAFAAALGLAAPESGAVALLLEPASSPPPSFRLPGLSELEALVRAEAGRVAAGRGPFGHLALSRALAELRS